MKEKLPYKLRENTAVRNKPGSLTGALMKKKIY